MAESRIERPRFCSQCGNPVVVADANFCKHCGAPLSSTVWLSHDITWRPLVAVLLSVIPGLGQWYKGQRVQGVLWFIFVVSLWSWSPPLGLLLYLICAANAALGGAIREEAVANSAGSRWRRHPRHRPTRRQMSPHPPAL